MSETTPQGERWLVERLRREVRSIFKDETSLIRVLNEAADRLEQAADQIGEANISQVCDDGEHRSCLLPGCECDCHGGPSQMTCWRGVTRRSTNEHTGYEANPITGRIARRPPRTEALGDKS